MSNSNSSNITNRLNNLTSQVTNAASKATNSVKNTVKKASNGISSQVKNVQQNVGEKLSSSGISSGLGNLTSGFGKLSNTTKEFAEKNSTVSKVVFILFLIILFGLLMRLGTYILGLLFTPSKNPIIVNGIRPTNKRVRFQVNPNRNDPKPILRSINEDQGTEFTWSTWFYIEDTDYGANNQPRLIFSKGMSNTDKDELSEGNKFVMNSPGVYLYDTENNTNKNNTVTIAMATYDENSDSVDIDNYKPYETVLLRNIPMQKWVHLAIRVQNRTVDVYLNGVLAQRKNLTKVPKQNFGNIHVGDTNNGMHGYISNLRYFNHAVGNGQIQDMVTRGPNLSLEGDEWKYTKPPYLAMRWYFDSNSGANPA